MNDADMYLYYFVFRLCSGFVHFLHLFGFDYVCLKRVLLFPYIDLFLQKKTFIVNLNLICTNHRYSVKLSNCYMGTSKIPITV